MTIIRKICGRGLPLFGDDIDTDQIIESRYLKVVTFRGIEAHLFESRRQQDQNSGSSHPLDNPQHAGASIMIVNANFGCGSSREHAPQAIRRFGIKAIVGVSFGEIFANNCLTIGLPCLTMTPNDALWLQQQCRKQPAAKISLDIAEKVLQAAGRQIQIDIPEGRKQRLLTGSWDSLGVLLQHSKRVEALFSTRMNNRQ